MFQLQHLGAHHWGLFGGLTQFTSAWESLGVLADCRRRVTASAALEKAGDEGFISAGIRVC